MFKIIEDYEDQCLSIAFSKRWFGRTSGDIKNNQKKHIEAEINNHKINTLIGFSRLKRFFYIFDVKLYF